MFLPAKAIDSILGLDICYIVKPAEIDNCAVLGKFNGGCQGRSKARLMCKQQFGHGRYACTEFYMVNILCTLYHKICLIYHVSFLCMSDMVQIWTTLTILYKLYKVQTWYFCTISHRNTMSAPRNLVSKNLALDWYDDAFFL